MLYITIDVHFPEYNFYNVPTISTKIRQNMLKNQGHYLRIEDWPYSNEKDNLVPLWNTLAWLLNWLEL